MPVGQRTFDDLGAPLISVPFCVVDLETTGGAPGRDAITEIGAVRFCGGEVQGTFHTLVNPGREIPATITLLTGITHAMVVEAPSIRSALPAFLEFAGGAVVVGHNVRFDLGFLNAAADELGYGRLPNRSVDTLGLARRLVGGETRRLDLASLAAYFRSPDRPTHRALEDARATGHVFHSLLERAGTLGVTALEDLLALPTAKGSSSYTKMPLTELLPRLPGVYLFYDRNGALFYVGKARNLRTRVRSYFYGDTRRTVGNMLRELDRIEHHVCETELEASVMELRLIHAHRPRYNVRSRPPRSVHFVRVTNETYPRLSIARKLAQTEGLHLGPFRSRRAAETVREALWDAAPIRRCSGRAGAKAGLCSFAQLGVAKCPCTGKLMEVEYRSVVDRVVEGITTRPSILLDPLAEKMTELARRQRFEEASWIRDRYRALARAIERRRQWRTLAQAGRLEVKTPSGEGAIIERAHLVAAWGPGGHPPLLSASDDPHPASEVPESAGSAEEAQLIWRWLEEQRAVIVATTEALVQPVGPIPELRLAG